MLEFPTVAEQVLRAYEEKRIRSIAVEARRLRADVARSFWTMTGATTEYTFDDDSVLMVRGRGKSYRAEALLPMTATAEKTETGSSL